MDYLTFILLVSALTGFVAGVLGSISHQKFQRAADKKRWDTIQSASDVDRTLKND